MAGVRWEDFNDHLAGYEEVVAQLIRREYDGAVSFGARGSESGIDLRLDTEHGLVIFECKNFTKIGSAQKSQIARSLESATQHRPSRWVLVVPSDLTPGLRSWFTALGADHAFPLVWLGRTWLDEQTAANDDPSRTTTACFGPAADQAGFRQSTTTNEVSAGTAGSVVQAQSITGDVHLHAPKTPKLLALLAVLLTAAVCSIAVAQWIPR